MSSSKFRKHTTQERLRAAHKFDSTNESRIMSEEVEENVPIFLSFSNLGVKINDRQILQNVSGKVHPGEMLAVMGPSGKRIILFCLISCKKNISLAFQPIVTASGLDFFGVST